MRPEAKERARAFIASPKTPRAIAGQSGDKTTYAVACALAVDFALDDADVRELITEYNRTKCDPPWPERDLERFVRSARKCANGKPGDVGKALNVDRDDYTGPRSPANNPAPKSSAPNTSPAQQKPKTGAPNPSGTSGRTPRTPFFEVRRAGEGAELRPTRTLRTALFLPNQNKEQSEKANPTGTASQPSVASEKSADAKPSEPSALNAETSLAQGEASDPSAHLDKSIIWADGEHWRKRPGDADWTYVGNINKEGSKRG